MLVIRDLNRRFGDLAVLNRLNLAVCDGEIVAVVGPSGCGKSTMLNIVAGLLPADSGSVETGGARLGYVFQEDRLLPWRTVAENIGLVRNRPDPGEVKRLIDLVGLSGFGDYYPGALSGGMRQRCSIARAYHYRCDFLLMDEPFKSLDHHLRFQMLETLMNVRREHHNGVLFITHDIDEALAIAGRIAVMGRRPGTIVREFSLGATDSLRNPDAPILDEVKQKIIHTITS